MAQAAPIPVRGPSAKLRVAQWMLPALCCALVASGPQPELAVGQTAAGFHGANPGAATFPGVDTPALRHFGGRPAVRPALPRARTAAAITPTPRTAVRKPFDGAVAAAPVSPYLSLAFRESATALPNYYALVRPQIQQQRQFEMQRAQFLKLQQQLRNAGAVVQTTPGGSPISMPTTGHSAQFQNYGGYFPGR